MSVPSKIQNRIEASVKAVKDSGLALAEKDDLIEMLTEARSGTNGLGLEEKTQANSENLANMTCLVVRHLLGDIRTTWKDVIIACRWNIVIVFALLIELLAIRPQIANIVETFIK